jgi:hypothetical protein
METLNQREKKMPFRRHSALFFLPFFEDFGGSKQSSTTFPARCQHGKGFYVAK